VAGVIEGAGTPEGMWRPFLISLGLPGLALDPAPERAVVVAPHPDDEVLGVGGLLALLAAAGTRVEALSVTDGEASHTGGSISPPALAAVRPAETIAALTALGLCADVRGLHQPDGGRETLERPVVEALRLEPGTWLLGPWSGDGHPDHEAVGRLRRRRGTRRCPAARLPGVGLALGLPRRPEGAVGSRGRGQSAAGRAREQGPGDR
jgi:LmbE family N-acetylglucosaminyl deacetylase